MSDTPDTPPPPPDMGQPVQSPTLPVPAAPPPPSPAAPVAVPAPSAGTTIQLPNGVAAASPWARLGAYFLEGVLMIVTLGIGWLIWGVMIGGTGQTPAKRLMGMRVIGAGTLQPVGIGKMFWVRWFLAGMIAPFAIVFTLGILLFMPFWDQRNQNLWDKISTTYVVTDPDDAWATKPSLN